MDNTLVLQKLINKLHYTGLLKEDGVYGPVTKRAYTKGIPFGIDKVESYEHKKSNTLNIKYVSQRIDYEASSRMCSVASMLTYMGFYGEELTIPFLDNWIDSNNDLKAIAKKNGWDWFITNERMEQITPIMVEVLKTWLNKDVYWGYLSIDKIKLLVKKGPVIAATNLVGRKTNNEKSGHYIVIIGQYDGNWIINDPWGMWENYYSTHDGEQVLIKESDLFSQWGVKSLFADNGKIGKEEDKSKFRVIY